MFGISFERQSFDGGIMIFDTKSVDAALSEICKNEKL
jgi:hypothetical protein